MAVGSEGTTIIMTSDEVEYLENILEACHVDRLFRTSDPIRTGVTNPISDPERTAVHDKNSNRAEVEIAANFAGPADDRIQQGSPSTSKRGLRAGTFARKSIRQSVNRV